MEYLTDILFNVSDLLDLNMDDLTLYSFDHDQSLRSYSFYLTVCYLRVYK